MSVFGAIGSVLSGFWRVLDEARRATVNILFLVLVLILVAGLLAAKPSVPKGGALVLEPRGAIVEEYSGEPMQRAVDKLLGNGAPETRLRDLLEALERGREDDRIKTLVLDLDGMGAAGLPTLQELATEIARFRESGKRVVALGDFYDQSRYLLAAQADEVLIHPQGAVFIQGYGRYRNYYREAIDKLRIDWNIFKVGEFKSYVEPYTRDDMSESDREASLAWLQVWWSALQADVTAARGLEAGALAAYVENFPSALESSGGDLAALARDSGLVDRVAHHADMEASVASIVGGEDHERGFRGIGHEDYLEIVRSGDVGRPAAEGVGIIVAAGEILPGEQPPGTAGADNLVDRIRQARDDDKVRAVVLRVDSPGGSVFASDIILDELEALEDAGKPVIVSMGDVAASGGYWISAGATEIWASPTTITGSIGIFAMLPTFQDSLDYLGIHTDGVGTTQFAGALRVDRELEEPVRRTLQASIEHGYEQFVGKVAEHRGMEADSVRAVAEGRPWSGEDALAHGLVDQLGGLREAVEAAARIAGLEEARPRYIERKLSPRERFIVDLLKGTAAMGVEVRAGDRLSRSLERFLPAEAFADLGPTPVDPLARYAYCFCDVR